MLKKLFSHTLIYGLAPQIVKLAQVFILPAITPYLTAKDYGIFGIVTATAGALTIFGSLGLNIVLANSFTKSPLHFKWLWRQIFGFLNLWSFAYAIIATVVIFLFLPAEVENQAGMIIVLNVLPLVLFAPSTTIGGLYYQLMQKPMEIALRSVGTGLLTLALNLYFIRGLKMGYMGWFWAAAIAQVINQFSYYYSLRYREGIVPIYNFKRRTILRHLKTCLPTLPHFYSYYILGSFDRVIMKMLGLPITEIGKYNAAQMPAGLVGTATNAANQAVSPLLLKAYKDDDRQIEKNLNFITMIACLTGSSVLCLFLKELLPVIIRSEGLERLYPMAIILVMAYNYRPMYTAANNRLFFTERTTALLKVTFIAAALSVMLNFLLIYLWGSIAAAIVLFVCFMYMGYSGFFIREFKESNGTAHYPLIWLSLTLVLTIFVYFAADFPLWVKVVIALIFCLTGGFSIRKIYR